MQAFNTFKPDICVLDVMLPNVDGFSLGRQIRNQFPGLPIIFLTAKIDTDDLVKGFESGGTDYIKKPFSVKELIVRINNQLQIINTAKPTNKNGQKEDIRLGALNFLPAKFELHTSEKTIKLSARESQILTFLVAHQNQSIERKALLMTVWGDDSYFNSRNLDVYIRKLRKYLSADERIEIVTLKGAGYHFIVP